MQKKEKVFAEAVELFGFRIGRPEREQPFLICTTFRR